jgi:hypothetical protein
MQVDGQLRSLLHSALNKYLHAVMLDQSEALVQDVADILHKEQVFYELMACMNRSFSLEMRDYQQYPQAVRDKLVEQLRARRGQQVTRLEQERRASSYAHAPLSRNDDDERVSLQSDDFDSIFDSAVSGAPPLTDSKEKGVRR